jgi:tRNA pseudouridine55 synthase
MNGILLINKPYGFTSRDVVNKVSKILNNKQIGHTGTLDPIATGVLVLCIGKATKLVEIITSNDKEYIAEVILGKTTDTLDITGNTIEEASVENISQEDIMNVLNSFKGKIKQQVPIYSSVKVNGKKLYEYARSNKEVELPIRDIEVRNIELINNIEYIDNNIKFKIKCLVSKGTYVRSLIRDIAIKLNTVGCMSALVRTKQGVFNINDCYNIEDIENNNYKLLTIKEALSDYKVIKVDNELEKKITNGMKLERFFDEEEVLILNQQEEVLAIYKVSEKDKNIVKPYKMLK